MQENNMGEQQGNNNAVQGYMQGGFNTLQNSNPNAIFAPNLRGNACASLQNNMPNVQQQQSQQQQAQQNQQQRPQMIPPQNLQGPGSRLLPSQNPNLVRLQNPQPANPLQDPFQNRIPIQNFPNSAQNPQIFPLQNNNLHPAILPCQNHLQNFPTGLQAGLAMTSGLNNTHYSAVMAPLVPGIPIQPVASFAGINIMSGGIGEVNGREINASRDGTEAAARTEVVSSTTIHLGVQKQNARGANVDEWWKMKVRRCWYDQMFGRGKISRPCQKASCYENPSRFHVFGHDWEGDDCARMQRERGSKA
jgi:hypothetical protein